MHSEIGAADLQVKNWEVMVEVHRQNAPSAVPRCERMLEKLRAERAAIPDTPENNQIGYVLSYLPVAQYTRVVMAVGIS